MRALAVVVVAGCWSSPSKPPPEEPKPEPEPKPKIVKDLVQPVIRRTVDDDPCGDPCNGVAGGTVGGVAGGPLPPPPPPPPPPPLPPQNIPPTMLEGNRTAGDKHIIPDDKTKTAITRSGKDRIVGSWKLCVSDTGAISVSQLKSTGFPDYDSKIETEMRNNWKYSPYTVNGRRVPVCTAITFIYQHNPPPPPGS